MDRQTLFDYDYIIIGSGFGGSVSALRLTEKGYKVLVVEKGKRFSSEDFAKTNWNLKRWLWIPFLRFFGIMKISIFRHAAILSGTGVGGGSLVYANTLPIPKKEFFTSGSWGNLADWQSELEPYYEKALSMLGANQNPKLFGGDLELEQLAQNLGKQEHFEHTNVAVYFGESGETVGDPYFDGKGPTRTGCNFCGGCMTGCRHNAKNTLDKNYLYLAEKMGATVMPETMAIDVKPIDNEDGSSGYVVKLKSVTKPFSGKMQVTSQGVIFSGGVLGTIDLLLKLRKKSLPNLSKKLGQEIRTNNETLISVSKLDKDSDVSKGVAIGSILHTDENSHLEVVRYCEGSDFWKLLHVPYTLGKYSFTRILKLIGKNFLSPITYFKIYCRNKWAKSTVVLLFMQTIDSTLIFKSNFLGQMISKIAQGEKPSPFIPESLELVGKYSQITNGKPTSFILETVVGMASTAHILGGSVMGDSPETGVIDKNNNVFGYKNMMVVDGSMISANPGVNPALSITAIAEHAMDGIEAKN